MSKLFTSDEIKNKLVTILDRQFGETPATASDRIFYKACAMILQDVLIEKRKQFASEKTSHGEEMCIRDRSPSFPVMCDKC